MIVSPAVHPQPQPPPAIKFAPASAAALMGTLLKALLGTRERITVDQWADTRRVLTDDASDRPGPWRTSAAPHTRGPMRALSESAVREVVLCFASQTGKSEILVNKLGHIAEFDPAPTMVVLPNAEDAQDFNKDRVQPAIKASPSWLDQLAGTRRNRHRSMKAKQTVFRGCKVYYRGSNSQAKVRSKPCKHRIVDEVDADEFQYTALEDVRQRAAAWPGGQMVIASIPSFIGQGVELELEKAIEYRYHVPCPACLKYLELRMSGLKWEGGASKANADRAAATAHYECDHCKAKLYEHHKLWMLTRGIWVPQGGVIERDEDFDQAAAAAWTPAEGEEGMELMPGCTMRAVWHGKWPPRVGFRLPAFYSPWVKWADIARGWCEQNGKPSPGWINGVLAEGYQPKGNSADPDQIIKHWIRVEDSSEQARAASIARGAYRLGAAPPAVQVITAGIDLQETHAYLDIRGWSSRCDESWLLWFDVIEAPKSDRVKTRESIFTAMARMFPRRGMQPLPIARWTIDSGQGWRTNECYALARASKGRGMACKGRPGTGMAMPAIEVLIDKWSDGSKMPGGTTLLEVNTWSYKNELNSILDQAPPASAPMRGPRAALDRIPDGRWHWPDPDKDAFGNDIRENVVEYLDQITSEHLICTNLRASERGAQPKWEWRKKPKRSRNHFLDALVYNFALAKMKYAMLGVTGMPGSGTAAPRTRVRFGRRGEDEE